MSFDVRPIPSSKERVFSSRYMEAKVLEDFRLLNQITENYSLGYLTESSACAMLNIINTSEESLLEFALEAADTLHDMTLESVIDADVPNINPFVGESVLDYKEIINGLTGESIYNSYTFERTWSNDNVVGKLATEIANEKMNNLKLYKESNGKNGFTEFERSMYESYPDYRVESGFLYERVVDGQVLSGAISLEDGYLLKDFISTRFTAQEGVETMMPVIPVDGQLLVHQSTGTVKDMVASTDSEINSEEEEKNEEFKMVAAESVSEYYGDSLRSSGAFIALEGVVYKNNIVFDSEVKKLFDKLKKYIRLSNPENDAQSFKSLINVKKNRYTFNFVNQELEPSEVINAIVGCGFKPIKENGIVIKYEKSTKGITMTAEFTSIDNGVIIFYEKSAGIVKESTVDEKIDFGLKCDASDVKDAAKRLKKIREDKDSKKEDYDEALNRLDHAIENFKEVEKEKNVKESAEDIISGFNNNKYTLSEILVKESSDDFVSERKQYIVEKVDSLNKGIFITESNIGEFIESVLSESPMKNVSVSCMEMVNSIFEESSEDFETKADVFLECLKNQFEEEKICETVLNQIDFDSEMFSEGTHDIDDDIKYVVELLNRLGYKVKYSCSGHNKTRIKEDNFRDGVYHGKLYTTARLTFDKKYNLKSIPEGWYENKNADKTSIYVRAFEYDKKDGTPNEAFEKWKSDYMNSLKKWVDNLDKADSDESDVKMESVIEDTFKEMSHVPETLVEEKSFDDFADEMMASFFE